MNYMQLQAKVLEGFYGNIRGWEGRVEKLKLALREVNALFSGNQFIFTKFTGKDELTMADVMMLTLIQRAFLLKDQGFEPVYEGEDFG